MLKEFAASSLNLSGFMLFFLILCNAYIISN